METARGARADDEVATEAKAFHRSEDSLVALVARMEGAVEVDVDEQVVGEVTEAFADDMAASVVGLDGAEGEGDFLLTVTLNGFPAAAGEDDGTPARLSEPELVEEVGVVGFGFYCVAWLRLGGAVLLKGSAISLCLKLLESL